MTNDPPAPGRAPWWRRHAGDLLGIGFLVLLALCYLSPALKDGPAFAPADTGVGLSALTANAVPDATDCPPIPGTPQPVCPHDYDNGDQITQAIPWSNEDWTLVHHGQWPWWNDLEGTGLPQFLNFESAPASLPSLVSYLAPLGESFLVIVLVRLLIMGIGVYACCRLLGCRPVAAAFGGATAMLSGSFAGWLGWAIAGTLCWSGAILAAAIWCWRGPRRAAPATSLALAVAFAIYGGFPEAYVLLAGFAAVLAGVFCVAEVLRRAPLRWRALGTMAGGSVAGVALAAPLWLPGLSVLRGSVRAGELNAHGMGLSDLALLFAQGYNGLPIAGSGFFGSPNYFESATYVGVLALVLGGVALVAAWRRPAVLGVAAGGLFAALLAYRVGPGLGQRVVVAFGLGSIDTGRALTLLDLSVALLGAIGLEVLCSRTSERLVRRSVAGCALLAALVLLVLYLRSSGHGLSPLESSLRRASLEWPVATVVLVGLFLAASFTALRGRRLADVPALRRALPAALVGGQSAFLLFAGVGINSYAAQEFPTTAATTTLSRVVGSSLVALDDGKLPGSSDVRDWEGVGFYPNVNVGYGVDELADHDPATPKAVFDSWPVPGAGQDAVAVNLFDPSVDTVALARRYGAAYLLVAPGQPRPAGTRPVRAIATPRGTEDLVGVPDSGRFVLDGRPLGDVAHPGDATYRFGLRALPTAEPFVAHVTDVAGWRLTANGRAVPTRRGPGDDIEATLPAGTTRVVLVYRAPHLLAALLLALVAALGLATAFGYARLRRAAPGPRARAHDGGGDERRPTVAASSPAS